MTTWLRMLPRWFNRLYARLFGYFWIPCPICGRDFGGHEAAEELLRGPGRMFAIDQIICWRCEDEVSRRNADLEPLVRLGPWERLRLQVDVVDPRPIHGGDPTT